MDVKFTPPHPPPHTNPQFLTFPIPQVGGHVSGCRSFQIITESSVISVVVIAVVVAVVVAAVALDTLEPFVRGGNRVAIVVVVPRELVETVLVALDAMAVKLPEDDRG